MNLWWIQLIVQLSALLFSPHIHISLLLFFSSRTAKRSHKHKALAYWLLLKAQQASCAQLWLLKWDPDYGCSREGCLCADIFLRSKRSLKCMSWFLGTFLKSYFNVTKWLDLFITISDTVYGKNRFLTFYCCHYWTLQRKFLVTRTFFSFSSNIAVSTIRAHPFKKKNKKLVKGLFHQ